jgi:hypothetical protein
MTFLSPPGKVYNKNSLHSFTFAFKNMEINELKVKDSLKKPSLLPSYPSLFGKKLKIHPLFEGGKFILDN